MSRKRIHKRKERPGNPVEAKPTVASERSVFKRFEFQLAGVVLVALRLALSLEPNLVDADYFLGSAYERMGDRQSARMHYRRAIVIAPGNQSAGAAAARLGG